MAQDSEVTEVLNDLIAINEDRIAGYEKADHEANEIETDLRAMFKNLAEQSRTHVAELREAVVNLGGEPQTGTTSSGKLYRVWMDIRSAFSFDNRMAVLENAEGGEDAAKKAYAEALEGTEFSDDIRQLLVKQQKTILAAHDTIKKARDQQQDVSRYPLTS